MCVKVWRMKPVEGTFQRRKGRMRVCVKAYELNIEFSRYTQCASKYLVKAVKLTWLEFTVSAKQEVNRKWCHKMSWGVPDWRVTHRSGVRAEWSGSTRNSTKNLVRLISLYGKVSKLERSGSIKNHVGLMSLYDRVSKQFMMGICFGEYFHQVEVWQLSGLSNYVGNLVPHYRCSNMKCSIIWYICEAMYLFLQILCQYSDGSISRCMKQWDVLYDNWSHLRC